MSKMLVLFLILFSLSISLTGTIWAGPVEATDFSLKDIDGKQFRLSDFKSKDKVLLFFWATWCPHCLRGLRELKDRKGDYKLVTINVGESKERVAKFLRKADYDFRVLLDKDGLASSIYGVLGIPTYIVIDKDFKISYKGYIFPADLN